MIPDLTVMRIDAADTTVVFDLRRGFAELLWLGSRLAASEDLISLCDAQRRGPRPAQADAPVPRSIAPLSGWGYQGTPSASFTLDGAPFQSRFALAAVSSSDSEICFTHVARPDRIALSTVWSIAASGMVCVKCSVANETNRPLGVSSLASLALPLPGWADYATLYSGRWAGEMRGERVPLGSGSRGAACFGGRSGFGGGNWLRVEAAETGEDHGPAILAHLAWSGDHQLQIERNADGEAILLMGARLDPGEVRLAPGGTWEAPTAMVAASGGGVAPARHVFHRHVLTQTTPHYTATRPRKVHLNSWEALGFDLAMPALLRLVDAAAGLGVERFVLDDGWFAGRRDDTNSLGDWTPDAALFPAGLGPLISRIEQYGLDFGLWVEPEMVSPDSDLYRRHPDWCLSVPGQPRPTQRGQLVLDLTKKEVVDHLFEQIDALLRAYPIAYLKWDHNRELFPLLGHGCAQVRALYRLLDRVRVSHPDVEIETCASGGGRVDLAILQRCSRFWASDNNDAVERLRINRGWFDFLPLAITGNHVGPSPNPITGQSLPMDFRAKVAMFGHMGVEADPTEMDAADRSVLAAHIALYKRWRSLLHRGDLHVLGCADPGVTGWMVWHEERGLALVAQTAQPRHFDSPPIRFSGLTRADSYRVRLLNPNPGEPVSRPDMPALGMEGLILSGQALADAGLSLTLRRPHTALLLTLDRLN